MLILPLKFIREEDKKVVGMNLFNLAKLDHTGLSVVESAVAIPPHDLFQKVIHKYQKHFPVLGDQIDNIKRSIMELEVPASLKNFNLVEYSKEARALNVDINSLWGNLLGKWAKELISKIERGEKNLLDFTPQLVVFSSNFSALGSGFFDEDRGHVVIKVDNGKPGFKESEEIERLILAGNKKLFLPQVFFWVIEDGKMGAPGGIKIIKILPYTQSEPKTEKKNEQLSSEQIKRRPVIKTATKILLDYQGGNVDLNCDGVFLRLEKFDADFVNEKISKLAGIGDNPTVIFYPQFTEGQIQDLQFAKTFLFFRNKKKLDASVVLPQTFSKDEFLKIKTDFASVGIYSKGTLKIWKEFETVQDFLNLDDYLDAGFDGALINLDKIIQIVTGVDTEKFLIEPKIDRTSSVEKFFKELGFNKLVKNHKQVLIIGKSIQNEEILNFFIKSGVWGITLEKNVLEGLREHISFLEKLSVKKLNR